MKSENQRTQSSGPITWLLAAAICIVVVTTEFVVVHLWKSFVWMMKQLFTKSPAFFRGIGSVLTWTGKTLMKMMPKRKVKVFFTPDIFANDENLAPAREFNIRKLNRLK